MAGIKSAFPTVVSTSYPTDPQLDLGDVRGSLAAIHMSPAGPDVFLSVDGETDHVRLSPTTCPSAAFDFPYYTKVWARLAAPGASNVQLVAEMV